MESMQKLIENMQRLEKTVGVEIGGVPFFDEDDVHSWAAENLPPSLPVGCFVDVYSFLDRILQFIGGLKDIEINHKLGLAGDDSLNLSSFTRECPRFFGQAVTASSGSIKTVASKSSLLALPTAAHWEDPKTRRELKEVLRRKMVNVNKQVLKNINSKLSSYPAAKALATSCLDATYSFVTSLMTYISETHDVLVASGFNVESSWQLVTQLIDHIFTDDMDKVRSFVREATDTHNDKTTALAVFWGTLCTHGVMQEYSKFGIANRPSISSEYVKFLVIQNGERDAGDNEKIDDLIARIESTDKIARAAKSAAASASNGLDQLKKQINNKK